MHHLAADLWRVYGVPWLSVDALEWRDFVVMAIRIEQERRARERT